MKGHGHEEEGGGDYPRRRGGGVGFLNGGVAIQQCCGGGWMNMAALEGMFHKKSLQYDHHTMMHSYQ